MRILCWQSKEFDFTEIPMESEFDDDINGKGFAQIDICIFQICLEIIQVSWFGNTDALVIFGRSAVAYGNLLFNW